MDKLSKEHRSWLMQRIRSKNTRPEMMVRSMLHRAGLRFSLRGSTLPGKPDIILRRFGAVIFVHGCFWHKHDPAVCLKPRPLPKTNVTFWEEKLLFNVRRDESNADQLRDLGWTVLTVWECELRKNPLDVVRRIIGELQLENPHESYISNFTCKCAIETANKRHAKQLRQITGSDSFVSPATKSWKESGL